MNLSRTPADGTFVLRTATRVALTPATRLDWQRALATTYTNDRLCPTCAGTNRAGYVTKEHTSIRLSVPLRRENDGAEYIQGSTITCVSCAEQHIRFTYAGRGYYFHQTPRGAEE